MSGPCRWCGSPTTTVLDLGAQPAADLFPLPTDPLPDPVHPLAMALCPDCGLAQLAQDATVPDEPRAVEPEALRQQARDAVARVAADGLLPAGTTVLEFGSPHGGSWEEPLRAVGAVPVTGGTADVVLDVFGLMHDADQRAALRRRLEALAPGGLLLVQVHSLETILRLGQWNALRHGHFCYFSATALTRMLTRAGLAVVDAWEFDLYGGTLLLGARRGAGGAGAVQAVLEREAAAGVADPSVVAGLVGSSRSGAAGLASYLDAQAAAGTRVLAYGAASRAVALLALAGADPALLPAVGDAAPAKHGRCLPGSRIPVISPEQLLAQRPDRVVLLVPDLLEEVRRSLPEVEASGARWVVLEPALRELGPGEPWAP